MPPMRLLTLAGLLAGAGACAQGQPAGLSDAERTRRDAESPLRWIKLHSGSDAASAPSAAKPVPGPGPAKAAPGRGAAVRAPASRSGLAAADGAPAPASSPDKPALPAPTASVASAPAPASLAPTDVPAPSAPELVPVDPVEPTWDPGLMAALRKGRVRLTFEVTVDGRLTHPVVAEATDPRLGPPALLALRQWHFLPIEQPRGGALEFGFDLDR